MAVRIRLSRVGATKRPSYRVVAMDSRRPRDGRALEILGFYDPLTEPATVRIDAERLAAWVSKGALPSETVAKLIKINGSTAAAPEAPAAKPHRARKPSAKATAKAKASTEASTEPATEAATEPATEASTEPATEAATEASTEPATEASTEAATEASTEAATGASTEAATGASTEPATEAGTEASTEPATEASTEEAQ